MHDNRSETGCIAVPVNLNNVERVHLAIGRLDDLLVAQDNLIQKIIGDSSPVRDVPDDYVPSLLELLERSPDIINNKVDLALSNIQAIEDRLYGS